MRFVETWALNARQAAPVAFVLALVLAIAGTAPMAHAADPAPVIAAERAFAARAAEVGIAPSFLEFMADDAIVFAPDPTSAKALYSARPPPKTPKEGGTLLAWWPNWAGMAASGDLGFTTGPAEVNGKRSVIYFTVWKRQADGSWKWIYDGGADGDADHAPGPGAPVLTLAAGARTALAPVTAFAQVQALEATLAQAAATDATDAYQQVLAKDARVQGSPAAPATTPRAVAEELASRAHAIDFSFLGGGASAAGDLAWTYGDARWPGGRGHYVRIWRRDDIGWRLVFDQVLEAPPPKNA